MSHGPGHIQRTILALIDAHPDGAWTTSELCQLVYTVDQVDKKHRVAVLRALRRIRLPDDWYIWRQGGAPHEQCLFSPLSVESYLKASWLYRHRHMTFEAFRGTLRAREVIERVEGDLSRRRAAAAKPFEVGYYTREERRKEWAWQDRLEEQWAVKHVLDKIARRRRELTELSRRLTLWHVGAPRRRSHASR